MFTPLLRRLEPFAREFVRHGKQVYLVGGAVRNVLLGRPVQDFDFTTDALPSEVQGYFRKVLPTGLQHGTVTVLFQGESYEVTTFRVDGTYTDGRRPDGVVFTPDLEQDLSRRDFTINALALNLADGTLTDPHGGQTDLARGVLRAIGDPGQRFDEDALRLLRLFRFASQLGFSIDAATLAAVPPRRALLRAVSRERVRVELTKAMAGARPELAWAPLGEFGFLDDLFAPLSVKRLDAASLGRLAALPVELRWSFWLTAACGNEPEAWDACLRALTFSNSERAGILGPPRALSLLNEGDPQTSVAAKAAIEAWGSRERVAPGVLFLQTVEQEGLWRDSRGYKKELLRIVEAGEPVFLGELAVDGRQLLAKGVAPGPAVGETLRTLQRAVWLEPGLNSPEALLRLVKNPR